MLKSPTTLVDLRPHAALGDAPAGHSQSPLSLAKVFCRPEPPVPSPWVLKAFTLVLHQSPVTTSTNLHPFHGELLTHQLIENVTQKLWAKLRSIFEFLLLVHSAEENCGQTHYKYT